MTEFGTLVYYWLTLKSIKHISLALRLHPCYHILLPCYDVMSKEGKRKKTSPSSRSKEYAAEMGPIKIVSPLSDRISDYREATLRKSQKSPSAKLAFALLILYH